MMTQTINSARNANWLKLGWLGQKVRSKVDLHERQLRREKGAGLHG
jgi:hypothetical protein